MSNIASVNSAATRIQKNSPVAGRSGVDADAIGKSAAKNVGFQRNGRAFGALNPTAMQRAMAPLSPYERQQAVQLARTLAPTRRASPHFNSAIPSHATGPYSGTQYTFTCCPSDYPTHGTNFTLGNMLDSAFRSGTKTVVSLTNPGDSRHSNYYKQSHTTPDGKYTIKSFGRPHFTTGVNDQGKLVTGSVFGNAVRNNQTGQTQNMKMVHVNGWADQTAIESKTELKILSDVCGNLDSADLNKVLIHCSEGRNRTGSVASHLEMMNASARGMKPNASGVLNWMRQSRVADSVGVPGQLIALAESSIRLGRSAQPAGNGFRR